MPQEEATHEDIFKTLPSVFGFTQLKQVFDLISKNQ
jgi:hypothetical protein